MAPDGLTEFVLPPALAAQVRTVAEAQHRPVADVLHDAVALYLREGSPRGGRSPAEAAARMRAARRGNVLPEGVTLCDLMTHGRA